MASRTNSRKIFVNLPVRDLKKSMSFFSTLGFTFNPQFTDENGACMVLSSEGFVMLLAEPFFKGFTKNEICDTSARFMLLGSPHHARTCDAGAEVCEACAEDCDRLRTTR